MAYYAGSIFSYTSICYRISLCCVAASAAPSSLKDPPKFGSDLPVADVGSLITRVENALAQLLMPPPALVSDLDGQKCLSRNGRRFLLFFSLKVPGKCRLPPPLSSIGQTRALEETRMSTYLIIQSRTHTWLFCSFRNFRLSFSPSPTDNKGRERGSSYPSYKT